MRPDYALALIITATLAAACSSQPRNAMPESVAQMPGAAGVATASAAPAVAVAVAPTGSVDPSLIKEGYRVVHRENQVLYCRTETTTGTAFKHTACLTAEQIQGQKRSSQNTKDELNKLRGNSCVGNTCSN
jgi:hypothetical protein